MSGGLLVIALSHIDVLTLRTRNVWFFSKYVVVSWSSLHVPFISHCHAPNAFRVRRCHVTYGRYINKLAACLKLGTYSSVYTSAVVIPHTFVLCCIFPEYVCYSIVYMLQVLGRVRWCSANVCRESGSSCVCVCGGRHEPVCVLVAPSVTFTW
jgi:hypothetical protein